MHKMCFDPERVLNMTVNTSNNISKHLHKHKRSREGPKAAETNKKDQFLKKGKEHR